MKARDLRNEIEDRLLAGESVVDIAEDLCLDVVDDGEPMVALDGWVADDGHAEVTYDVASGREAAEEYVSDGDWGDDDESSWVTVYTWRRGLRTERVECVYCAAPATAHDYDGDPACAEHARPPAEGVELAPIGLVVVESGTDRESHKVEIAPDELACVDGEDHHDWQSPVEIVGGSAENPGVWAHGGGMFIHEVCMRCGCGRHTDTWAQDPVDGEQGLRSVRYVPGEHAASLDE